MSESSDIDIFEVQLMDLPDELLVEIFAHLDDEVQVLKLRAVCRRWQGLLLHPHVWRHRSLYDFSSEAIVKVLSSPAPCLKELSLQSYFLESHGVLAASTKCAVQRIEFGGNYQDLDLGMVALVIRNQAALGRLREVCVDLDDYSGRLPPAPDYRVFLRTLCEVEGLTTLDLTGSVGSFSRYPGDPPTLAAAAPRPVPSATVRPSLVRLVCAEWLPDAVLECLLRSHAATLEDVDVESVRPGCRVPVAALLSGAPRLRVLTCSLLLPDMVQLKKCPALKGLVLRKTPVKAEKSTDALWHVTALLRQATQLEKVELGVSFPWWRGSDVEADTRRARLNSRLVVDLVSALAASRCAQLRSLSLSYFSHLPYRKESEGGPVPRGVGGALAGLRHLHTLDVRPYGASAAFLAEVTPGSAPALRWLRVQPGREEGEGGVGGVCAHAWFHGESVLDALRRNRRLHLQLDKFDSCEDPSSSCAYCVAGCHRYRQPDVDYALGHRPEGPLFTVFAHPKTAAAAGCGEAHGDGWEWCELAH